MNIFIVGKWVEGGQWVFEGVFDKEEDAVAACVTDDFFVGPCVLNELISPENDVPWPGQYYPLQEGS